MGLPDVSVNILNGQLGRTEGTSDGVAGLIVSGVAGAALALDTPAQIFSTDDAVALDIDKLLVVDDADPANDEPSDAFRQIQDFYKQAGEGAELWIMIVDPATSMNDLCDKSISGNKAKILLDAAGGSIRMLGVTRTPASTYTASYVINSTNVGIDRDVVDAVAKAQELADEYTNAQKPFRVMVEGRDFQGTVADLYDFTGDSNRRVAVIGAGLESGSKAAAVGMALGAAAALPVQRKISRVRNGDLGLTEAFLTNGSSVSSVSESELGQMHDKGVIVPRSFSGINGFFFSGDQTATSSSDDFSSFARGRVIDKALVLSYQTLVQEIDDDIALAAGGQLPPVVIKSYKANVDNVFNAQMVSQGEASSAELIIDANQNILSSDQVNASVSIVPTGYSTNIVVDLQFDNPTV